MQRNALQKIVYRDGDNTKAITGEIISEDEYLITVRATYTNTVIRIGKSAIISIKPKDSGGF